MAVKSNEERRVRRDREGVVFQLGKNEYCLDIDHIDEIVERGKLTPLPDSAEHFEGVMNLRGETTSIFNPCTYFDISDGTETADGNRILILDLPDASVGWIVDSVDRVTEFATENVEAQVQEGAVEGVLRREDGFIIVIDPEVIEATA